MKSATKILVLASAALSSPTASALNFAFDTEGCDGSDPFINLDVDVACNGTSACTFGDTAVVEGTVYARQSFSSDANVTMSSCLFDRYCPPAYTRDVGMLCDWLAPTDGEDGQECGDLGNYEVVGEGVIPGSKYLIGFSRIVTVRIGVDGGCGSDEGEESEAAQQLSGSFEMTFSAAGGALVALGAAAYAVRRRRRRIDGDDERGERYVEMVDSAAIV